MLLTKKVNYNRIVDKLGTRYWILDTKGESNKGDDLEERALGTVNEGRQQERSINFEFRRCGFFKRPGEEGGALMQSR